VDDAFQWLEELHSKKSLEWVEAQNLKTLAEWTHSDRFESMRTLALHLLSEKNRLTMGTVYRDHVYHLWKDVENPLGLWRKAHLSSLKRGGDWFPLLDLAQQSREKGVETVLSRALFLNGSSRVLLSFSPQGKDVREIKEWDLERNDFVDNGFQVSLSKDDVEWVTQDHVLWARTERPTHCGYASQVYSWRRGQAPDLIFEAPLTSMAAGSVVLTGDDGQPQVFVCHWLTWDNIESFYWQDGKLQATGFPTDAYLSGLYQDRVLLWLKSKWGHFPAGSVIIGKKSGMFAGVTASDFEFVFEATDAKTFQDLAVSKDGIAIFYSDFLRNRIQIWDNGRSHETDVPDGFTVSGISSSVEKDRLFTSFQSFTEPPAWYQWQDSGWRCLQTSARQFNPVNVQCKHEWAISQDGTKVPYWVVFRDDQLLPKPTIQLGYGGFLTSQFPTYSALVGSLWIEQGGAFVLAQIRGGAELGVSWHDSAVKENKQKSYDDFIAISEDLIAKGYTTAAQLAIRGRSNGGLLVGATITQRPDLYGAALIEVPLLDMIRYVELPPGSSWMDEFGDPRDPKMRETILKYSPYQNIERHGRYPPILIRTARSDDRVHPGHARKMAAKFQSLGHQVWFFEEELGGHASTPIPEQAFQNAVVYEFFWRNLSASGSADK
jgi:prolyl oligopeptidase